MPTTAVEKVNSFLSMWQDGDTKWKGVRRKSELGYLWARELLLTTRRIPLGMSKIFTKSFIWSVVLYGSGKLDHKKELRKVPVQL